MSTLGIIVVAALLLSIFVFKVPERIGLIKPAYERVLSQTPDRETAQSIMSAFQNAGVDTTGLTAYVFPEKNSKNSMLLTVADSSQGFDFSNYGTTDPIPEFLVQLANSSSTYNIDRVAFEYLDDDGNPVVDVTAPTTAILQYSSGQISETAFLKAIDAKIDFSQFVTMGLP
ncbi:MAG: hypothetical protein ACLPVI_02535 [Dehalococcoidales bacterium]